MPRASRTLSTPRPSSRVATRARATVRGRKSAAASKRRPGDPPVLVAAADKIHRDLGWQPRYPDLRPIVETAWNWHRRHPTGYED